MQCELLDRCTWPTWAGLTRAVFHWIELCYDPTPRRDDVSDRQLRFAIEMVGHTAEEWSGRLQHVFGGATHHEARTSQSTTKPGTAGYL